MTLEEQAANRAALRQAILVILEEFPGSEVTWPVPPDPARRSDLDAFFGAGRCGLCEGAGFFYDLELAERSGRHFSPCCGCGGRGEVTIRPAPKEEIVEGPIWEVNR